MTVDLTCPYCSFSKKVPREKIPAGAKWATCPRCRRRFDISTADQDTHFATKEAGAETRDQGAEEAENVSLRKGAPWEERSELGLWQGIYQTIKEVLFSPNTFFSTLTFKGGLSEPFAFGLLVGSLGRMFGSFWLFLMMSGGLLSLSELIFGQLTVGSIFLRMMILIPLFVIIRMFISSAVWHLFLLIVRGGNNGYEATFRVISYSQAVQAWALVPFVGGLISTIWQFIVQIIGLREIHETSYLRVILAFFIPICIIGTLIIAAIVFLIISFGHHYFDRLWF
jgi:hypothetical protein